MTNELLINAALLSRIVLSRVRDKCCEQTHSTQSLVLNTVVGKLIHGTMATDNDNTFWYTSSKVWFPQRISISSTNNLKEEEEEQEDEVLFA